jgi:hypothetical protein
MARAGNGGAALGYLLATLFAAVAAALVGVTLTRFGAALWLRRRTHRSGRS